MKLVGIVTVFYPDVDVLVCNIRTYVEGVNHLIVYDNTPSGAELSPLSLAFGDKITIIRNHRNDFLAIPYNLAIDFAERNSFTHILTMDQDSSFKGDDFSKYLSFIKNFHDGLEDRIGCFAVNIGNKRVRSDKDFEEKRVVISSGSILSLNILQRLPYKGRFREDFAIDALDTDLSLRMIEAGYRIVQYNCITLVHNLGHSVTKYGIRLMNYSATRTYYLVRNTLFTISRYRKIYPGDSLRFFFKTCLFFRFITLFLEDDALKKYKAFILGIYHFLIGRTGVVYR